MLSNHDMTAMAIMVMMVPVMVFCTVRVPFDELLATADVVSMHASLSPSTRYAIVQNTSVHYRRPALLHLDLILTCIDATKTTVGF
jgi:phosphoglycerate dehydrogenase-like enzyme